jgi:hypothetical protein
MRGFFHPSGAHIFFGPLPRPRPAKRKSSGLRRGYILGALRASDWKWTIDWN